MEGGEDFNHFRRNIWEPTGDRNHLLGNQTCNFSTFVIFHLTLSCMLRWLKGSGDLA